jgi:exosortase/archaeosortase family protein
MQADGAAWPPATRLRFGLVVSSLAALVLLTSHRPVPGDLIAPLDVITGETTARLLAATSLEVHREGTLLSHPEGFAYRVYWRCTGLLPALFLSGLILASPGGLREKWIGVATGTTLVLVVNQVRLVHLFHIGVRHPSSFHVFHSVVWEAATVGVVLGAWAGWLRWSARRLRGRSC